MDEKKIIKNKIIVLRYLIFYYTLIVSGIFLLIYGILTKFVYYQEQVDYFKGKLEVMVRNEKENIKKDKLKEK